MSGARNQAANDDDKLNLILNSFPDAKRSGDGWTARCPAHEDSSPSLSIAKGKEQPVVLCCHAGCTPGEILAALGLTEAAICADNRRELPRPTPKPSKVSGRETGRSRYEYKDVDGNVVATKVRVDSKATLPDGTFRRDKFFSWERDGKPSLGGLPVADLFFYGSEHLKEDPGAPVVICEGAKAAEGAGRARGLIALGTDNANTVPSRRVLETLRGRRAVLWPDNDDPGRKHMAELARALDGIAHDVKMVTWPEGSPERADAADVTLEQMGELLGAARPVKREASAANDGAGPSRLLAFTLDKLLEHRFPARKALLCRDGVPIFREGHIGEVYATRGLGKTWFLQTIALIASAQAEAFGIYAPEPCRVLYVDGEMSSEEVQERFQALCRLLKVEPPANLTVLGADWQEEYLPRLDTPEGQDRVEPFVEAADLIILDNRSCLFDSEGEKDPSAWQPAQDWLLSLRRRGKATLLAHHANRQGGARGISKAEDPMNLLLKLTHPEGYTQDQGARFLVEFDKARGVHGAAASSFVASLTDTGWIVEGGTAQTRRPVELDDLIVGYVEGRPGCSKKEIENNVPGRATAIRGRVDDLTIGATPRLVKVDGRLHPISSQERLVPRVVPRSGRDEGRDEPKPSNRTTLSGKGRPTGKPVDIGRDEGGRGRDEVRDEAGTTHPRPLVPSLNSGEGRGSGGMLERGANVPAAAVSPDEAPAVRHSHSPASRDPVTVEPVGGSRPATPTTPGAPPPGNPCVSHLPEDWNLDEAAA